MQVTFTSAIDTDKKDCVHNEYSPIETYKKKAISNLSREKNVDAIVDYSIETSDNPIREKMLVIV